MSLSMKSVLIDVVMMLIGSFCGFKIVCVMMLFDSRIVVFKMVDRIIRFVCSGLVRLWVRCGIIKLMKLIIFVIEIKVVVEKV